MVYCAGKPMEILCVLYKSVLLYESVLLHVYKSNRPPAARDLQILLVFFQHHKWFIRL